MKKYILSFLMLGVGILAAASKAEARIPTDDWDNIAFFTSNSSSVFVSTQCPIELISATLSSGNDVKYLVIVDTNPANSVGNLSLANILSTAPLANFTQGNYPVSQWAAPPMIFNTSTAAASGVPKPIDLRGTIIRNGLCVFKDSLSVTEYYTLRYRTLR